MKIVKPKDFKGNYKVKIDRRKLKGSRNILNGYSYTNIIEGEFFAPGIMDQKITIKSWIWNWKFPFLHRKIEKYTLIEWQKKVNKWLNDSMDR